MLALILGLAGGGLLFYFLCLIAKGTVSNGGIPIGALLAFLFTPMVVLLAATAMAGVLLICSIIKILLAKKK